jgi:hypothetical protein
LVVLRTEANAGRQRDELPILAGYATRRGEQQPKAAQGSRNGFHAAKKVDLSELKNRQIQSTRCKYVIFPDLRIELPEVFIED